MRLIPLLRFETARRLRPGGLALCWGIFLSIHWIGAANGLDSDGLFGYAFLAALGIGFQPGLRNDAERGFSRLCAVSLFSAPALATARLVSWLVWLGLLGMWAFACTAVLPGGIGPDGGQRAVLFTSLGAVLLPFAAGMDRWAGLRLPLMTVYLVGMAAAVVLSALGGDPSWILGGLGLDPTGRGGGSPMPLMARVPFSVLVSWAVFLERRPGRRRSLAGTGRPRFAVDGRDAMVDSDLHPKRHGSSTRIPFNLPDRRAGDRPGTPALVPGMDATASPPSDGAPPG